MQGKGVDIILDCVGAPYMESNLKCLSTDGCIVYIGWMGGKAQTCPCSMIYTMHTLFPSTQDLD